MTFHFNILEMIGARILAANCNGKAEVAAAMHELREDVMRKMAGGAETAVSKDAKYAIAPLVWHYDESSALFHAGPYVIAKFRYEFTVAGRGRKLGWHGNLELAKAAAEADHREFLMPYLMEVQG